MVELSESAQAALILHSAQRAVSCRTDGAWSILDKKMWDAIHSLPAGPEHSFVLAVVHSHIVRVLA